MSIQFRNQKQILVYTSDKKIKACLMSDIKTRNINYVGWYCPIHEYSMIATHRGEFFGGVCSQMKFNTPKNPWWDEINNEGNIDTTCKMYKGACKCGQDIYAVKAIDKKTYDEFIASATKVTEVEDLQDEDEIVALGHKNVATGKKTFEFMLDYGKRCNYDCSYCSPAVHDNHSPFLTLDQILYLFTEIKLDIKNDNTLRITGGEPTLGKDLETIVKLGKLKGFNRITINSNGTGKDYKYERLAELGCITHLSIHHEFTSDKVLERMLRLKLKYPKNFHVKFMVGIEKNNMRERVEAVFKDHPGIIEYAPIFILPRNETNYETFSPDIKPIKIVKKSSLQDQ